MNYFAHGRPFLDRPYCLAGVSLPDWLNVVNRRARAPARLAAKFADDPDRRMADLAQGIIQHHEDDRWFHSTAAFAELSLRMTVQLRERLPGDHGFRPSFLGHILVELLLDDVLIQAHPEQAEAYYEALASLDRPFLQEAVNRLTTQPVQKLDAFLLLFLSDRFLYDYADDKKLLWRLNRVMQRVGLQLLPDELEEYFPEARHQVRQRSNELLAVDR